MTSLISEETLYTVPDPSVLRPKTDRVSIRRGDFVDVVITSTINGNSVNDFVFVSNPALFKNKSLEDSSTRFVDATDNTKKVAIDAGGASGTTSTIRFAQSTDRVYNFADPGVDCNMVTSEGDVAINGVITMNGTRRLQSGYTVQSINTTPTTVATIAIGNNAAYYFTTSALCTTSAGDTGAFKSNVKVKNVGGVVTLGTPHNNWDDVDAAISDASIIYSVSGTNLLVQVVGTSTPITWNCNIDTITITIS